jgi:glucose/mannose-6-phosphate isomerase
MYQLLDQPEELVKRDRNGMLSIVGRFDRMLEEAIEISHEMVPSRTNRVERVILLGLGGSAIGGDLVKAYLGSDLKIPFEVNRSYSIPGYVDRSTLVLASSYSGNTEETLAAFQKTLQRQAVCVCLTSGGELENLARQAGVSVAKFPRDLPPRTALPYSLASILSVLSCYGLIRDRSEELVASLDWVRGRLSAYGPETYQADNPAKSLAQAVQDHIPIIYGSQDRLHMIAKRWASQFAENGKQLAYASPLPEMNHNEIVGWEHPESILGRILPVFLRDHHDHPRVQIRAEVTREILAGKGAAVLEYWSLGETWMERFLTLVLLGDYASVYLAFLNDEDPTPVEMIDAFKVRLKQY